MIQSGFTNNIQTFFYLLTQMLHIGPKWWYYRLHVWAVLNVLFSPNWIPKQKKFNVGFMHTVFLQQPVCSCDSERSVLVFIGPLKIRSYLFSSWSLQGWSQLIISLHFLLCYNNTLQTLLTPLWRFGVFLVSSRTDPLKSFESCSFKGQPLSPPAPAPVLSLCRNH